MKTSDIVAMVESLPVDIKTVLLKKILESLSPSQEEIDRLWAKEAEKRVRSIKNGKGKTIPGGEVFKEVKAKYGR